MKRLLPPLLLLIVVGCDGDTSVRACFGSDEFCDRVFAPHPPPEATPLPDQSTTPSAAIAVDDLRIAAVRVGLASLSSNLVPEPLQTVEALPLDAGFTGLWLGARILAAAAALEPEPDVLLDQLRVLAVLQHGLQWHDEPVAAARLRVLGYRHLAVFTATRDPGTAELARALVGRAPVPGREEWWEAIATGELGFPAGAAAADLEAAALALLTSPARMETANPARIAAATVLLLLSL